MDSPDTTLSASGPVDRSRFTALDGVRALAAFAVVLTHIGFQSGAGINGPARTVLSRLDLGVALFFVLSGFLLHRPQAVAAMAGTTPPATLPYLWRRALRVLPGYWLAVAAALLLLPANDGATAADWVRQLTLTAIYGEGHLLPGLTQMWSLSTEVSFYLALPLLGRIAGRTLRSQLTLCAAMLATGLVWQWLIGQGTLPPYTGYWLTGHADWFALGMALAALSAAGITWLEDLGSQAATCWLGAAALFVIAGTPLTGPYELSLLTTSEALTRTVLYGVTAVFLLAPAVAHRPRGPLLGALTHPATQFVGRISYGVFLLHLTVLALVLQGTSTVPFTGHFWRLATVVVPVSLLVAWASSRLLEQPAMRLRSWGPGRGRDGKPQGGGGSSHAAPAHL